MYNDMSSYDASMYFNGVVAIPKREGIRAGVVSVMEDEFPISINVSGIDYDLDSFFDDYSLTIPKLGWVDRYASSTYIGYTHERTVKQGLLPRHMYKFSPIECNHPEVMPFETMSCRTDDWEAILSDTTRTLEQAIALMSDERFVSRTITKDYALFRAREEGKFSLFWEDSYIGAVHADGTMNIKSIYAADQLQREMEKVNAAS